VTVTANNRVGADVMSLELLWLNPLTLIRASSKGKEAGNRHSSEQNKPNKIRACRANWNAHLIWAF